MTTPDYIAKLTRDVIDTGADLAWLYQHNGADDDIAAAKRDHDAAREELYDARITALLERMEDSLA